MTPKKSFIQTIASHKKYWLAPFVIFLLIIVLMIANELKEGGIYPMF